MRAAALKGNGIVLPRPGRLGNIFRPRRKYIFRPGESVSDPGHNLR